MCCNLSIKNLFYSNLWLFIPFLWVCSFLLFLCFLDLLIDVVSPHMGIIGTAIIGLSVILVSTRLAGCGTAKFLEKMKE